jgi:hypothetical protein
MSSSNIFVAVVIGLDRGPGILSMIVHFDNGRSAGIDWDDPRSATFIKVLGELGSMNLSAYVELDSTTQTIKRLLIPLEAKVINVECIESQDVEVELEFSNARHLLKRVNPDFKRLRERLQDAKRKGVPVRVTEDESGSEIIDVSQIPNPPSPAMQVLLLASSANWSPTLTTVTPARAQELFSLIADRSCDALASQPSCIPFLYPRDGCAARAHEMCRLMILEGEQPGKLWIYGSLQADTPNDPDCRVPWFFHVAPTLMVDAGFRTQPQVIDPALFGRPVSKTEWKRRLGDSTAALVATNSSPFFHSLDGTDQFDPAYARTIGLLGRFRQKLQLRSASSVGPPPFKNCL